MPWWTIGYLFLFIAIGVGTALDEARSARPRHALGELLATAVGATFVIGLWHVELRRILGHAVIPMFLAMLVWEIASNVEGLREVHPDARLSPGQDRLAKWLGYATGILVLAPALGAGAWLSWRTLQGTAP